MKTLYRPALMVASLAVLSANSSIAANRFDITVSHDLAIGRPFETVVIPFAEV